MEIKKLNIKDLKHADYNPRKDLQSGDSEYEKIKKSIAEFGYVEPVIVNKFGQAEGKYLIVGGHQRTKVLSDLGYEEIECVVIDVDQNKEKALNVALNKISGEWDFTALGKLLDELKIEEYDVEITGFDWSEAEKLMDDYKATTEKEDVDDKIPDPPEVPFSKRGDVWILGKHKLMCGDSTLNKDVEVLMEDDRADMVFTDPPWNVNLGSVEEDNPQGYRVRSILNDFMGTEDFKEFMNSAFNNLNKFSKDGCMTYIVMSGQEWGNMMLTLTQNDYHWSSTIIWNKDTLVLSRKDYHTKYEPIWYGWKEGSARLNPLTDRKQCDVWDIPRPKVSELHPTTKPVELVVRALKNSSDIRNVVLDLFGGSGTTLIASEETDRICRMMELDEKYVDVIVKRYIDYVESDGGVYLIRDGKKISYKELTDESL